MSIARYLAPLFASIAVACGAADASQSTGTTTQGETPSSVEAHGSTMAKSGTTSTTSTTQSATLPSGETVSGDDTSTAAPDAPFANATGIKYRGVNLAGADFSYTALPGVEGKDYGWPTHEEVDYFTAKGMNTFRVGFLWERIQPKQQGELTEPYAAKLDDVVDYATSHGANVMLNPQNFAKYYGVAVGSKTVPNASFADFWKRLAQRYGQNPHVMFGLMNEPNGLATEQWASAANAAITAIRSTGATNLIHVPGVAWTGAHSWSETWYGTSNAKAMLDIVDPGDNFDFEVHQYLDDTSGGILPTCTGTNVGTERLQGWLDWLRANGKKGFVGEFAGGNNATCNAAVTDMLKTMSASGDVLNGWLWWAAGPRWSANYMFSIEPSDGKDAPQMALLAPYLP